MISRIIFMIAIVTVLTSCNQNKKVEELKTEKDKASYAVGLSFERNLEGMEASMPLDESPSVDDYIKGIQSVVKGTSGKSQSYIQGVVAGSQIQNYLSGIKAEDKIDFDIVYAAIRSKYNKDSVLISEDSIGLVIQEYFRPFDEEAQKRNKENAQKRTNKKKEENQKASQDYLNANKSKPGVSTMENGVQIKTLQEGTGASPTDNDKVVVNYTGKLVNGEQFDSSKGTPITNALTGFVPGFTAALREMKKGGKYEIVIPADQAYGDQAPQQIGPGQALVFEVELVDVVPFSEEELKQKAAQEKAQKEAQQKQIEAMMKQQQAQQAGQGAPAPANK